MIWEDKIRLANSLNNEKYEDAVELMRLEKDWDDQCLDMFVRGFDLTKLDLLEPIKNRLMEDRNLSFYGALRLSIIYNHFKGGKE